MSNRLPLGGQPSGDEICLWREGYRRYLIGKGMPPEAASDIAAKVPYRADLYPVADHDRRSPLISCDPGSDTVQPPSGKTSAPASCSTTARMRRLLNAASEIAAEPPSGKNIVFLHSTMCQLGLPRSHVEGTAFDRQCGNKALRVTAGSLWDGERFVPQPVPYGSFPRLILPWVNAAAKRLDSLEVPLGRSGREFLRTLGKDTSGGKKGAYTMLKRQMLAIVASRLTLGFNAGDKAVTRDSSPVGQIEAWQVKGDQPLDWPQTITLSESYFKELTERAVPLDWRALKALRGSALAMDAYMMLAERLHRISGRSLVYWNNFYEQFGQEYQGKHPLEDFKRAFRLALRDALTVYPQARVKRVTGGLILLPSPPPVAYKEK